MTQMSGGKCCLTGLDCQRNRGEDPRGPCSTPFRAPHSGCGGQLSPWPAAGSVCSTQQPRRTPLGRRPDHRWTCHQQPGGGHNAGSALSRHVCDPLLHRSCCTRVPPVLPARKGLTDCSNLMNEDDSERSQIFCGGQGTIVMSIAPASMKESTAHKPTTVGNMCHCVCVWGGRGEGADTRRCPCYTTYTETAHLEIIQTGCSIASLLQSSSHEGSQLLRLVTSLSSWEAAQRVAALEPDILPSSARKIEEAKVRPFLSLQAGPGLTW